MERRMRMTHIAVMSFLLFSVLMSGIGSPSVHGTDRVSKSSSPTYVNGGIYADTTWNSSQSPVVVTGDVVLFPDYTLTIEPSVEVLFYPNTMLTIRGTLNATGLESLLIRFDCPNGTWEGIKIETDLGGRATIKFAVFCNASTAVMTSLSNPESPVVEISDSVFFNNTVGLGGHVGGSGTLVERCIFDNNTYGVTDADYDIYDSIFVRNTYGLYATERANVYFSTFTENQVGLFGGRGEVMFNNISHNGIGIQGSFEDRAVQRNTVSYNTVGVILSGYDTYPSSFQFNNIYNNSDYSLKNSGDSNRHAQLNWWGTTNTTEIDLMIYDGHDNMSFGLVEFEPILTEPAIIPPPIHDLALTGLTVSHDSVSAGELVYISVDVLNEGTFDENSVVIAYCGSFQLDGEAFTLAKGDTVTLWIDWETGAVPSGNYSITAELVAVPGETDLSDNTFVGGEVRVVGDDNDDSTTTTGNGQLLSTEAILVFSMVSVLIVVLALFRIRGRQ